MRARATLQLVAQHRLQVLNRRARLRLAPADRLLWVWLSRARNEWRVALVIVTPETNGW